MTTDHQYVATDSNSSYKALLKAIMRTLPPEMTGKINTPLPGRILNMMKFCDIYDSTHPNGALLCLPELWSWHCEVQKSSATNCNLHDILAVQASITGNLERGFTLKYTKLLETMSNTWTKSRTITAHATFFAPYLNIYTLWGSLVGSKVNIHGLLVTGQSFAVPGFCT